MIRYTFDAIRIMPDLLNPGRWWVGDPSRILAYCDTREEALRVYTELRDMVLRAGQTFRDKEPMR